MLGRNGTLPAGSRSAQTASVPGLPKVHLDLPGSGLSHGFLIYLYQVDFCFPFRVCNATRAGPWPFVLFDHFRSSGFYKTDPAQCADSREDVFASFCDELFYVKLLLCMNTMGPTSRRTRLFLPTASFKDQHKQVILKY